MIERAEAGDGAAGELLLEWAAYALELGDTLDPEHARYVARRLWAALGRPPLRDRKLGPITIEDLVPRPPRTAAEFRRALHVAKRGRHAEPPLVRELKDGHIQIEYALERERGTPYLETIRRVAERLAVGERSVKEAVERLGKKVRGELESVAAFAPGLTAKHAPKKRSKPAPKHPPKKPTKKRPERDPA